MEERNARTAARQRHSMAVNHPSENAPLLNVGDMGFEGPPQFLIAFFGT